MPPSLRKRSAVISLFGLWAICSVSFASEVLIATATNFTIATERLKEAYEASTRHRIHIISGSTGKLYAQILRGAPFEILLAADQQRPELLEQDGQAVAGSRFTYAIGGLALWMASGGTTGDQSGMQVLRQARRIAIANPDLAPYGAAAWQAMGRAGLQDELRDRIVMGENVAQAYAMVATGNADMGLVAMSMMRPDSGSRWLLPASLHEPINQDAVLLVRGEGNPAALGFLSYLRSAEARQLIEGMGFRTPTP
jgi:molybdate transport system substrate-binding protein